MTVNDLIVAALRRLRVISGADPPSGDDMNDALLRLTDWLDDLRTQDFLALFEQTATWPLNAGQVLYEMPNPTVPGLVAVPPFQNAQEIHSVGYVDGTGNTILVPLLTDDAYAMLPNKTVPGRLPSYFYFRGAAGVASVGYKANLFVWPVPNAAGLQGVIRYAQPVGNMTLSTVLDGNANLPPGWRRFLRDGLAVELAPEFHVTDPTVIGPLKASADESRANIKRKARRLRDLAVPEHFSMRGGGNIYTG